MVLKHSHLNYFVTVAEAGQITRAARMLHIAQPALSQAINQLEAQLGVTLLERHPRGVSLTVAGEVFLEKARLALAAQADAAATAASLARDLRGALQIGFLSVPPMLMAPTLLDAFGRANPGVEVTSRELRFPTAPASAWLAGVDAALCHAPVPDPELSTLVLRMDPRVVVVSAEHPLAGRVELTVADVLDETFMACHPSVDPDWQAFWNLDAERGRPPTRLSSAQPGNTLEQVAAMGAGGAISVFPSTVASVIVDLVPSLVAVPLIDVAPAPCALVWHRARPSAMVAELVALARALVAKQRSGGGPAEPGGGPISESRSGPAAVRQAAAAARSEATVSSRGG